MTARDVSYAGEAGSIDCGRRRHRRPALTGAVMLAAVQLAPALARDALDPNLPGILDLSQAKTADEVQDRFYDYIWASFIALNWPNEPIAVSADGKTIVSGYRGAPDVENPILNQQGSQPDGLAVSVWETYKEPGEVFLPPEQWADYPTWNTPRPQPPVDAPGARRLLQYSRNFAEYATDINQPYFFPSATGPLVDRNANFVRYEVAINESFFEYVRHFQYYDANRQIADVRTTIDTPITEAQRSNPFIPRIGFKRPPYGVEPYLKDTRHPRQGLVDVKAAWRVLEPDNGDRPERYLHRRIVVDEDGTTRLMGLVALHILRYIQIRVRDADDPHKTMIQLGYVASTFEQVDNVEGDPTARPPVKASFNDGTPPNAVQSEYGFEYSIPPLASKTDPKPQAPVNIYRARAQVISPAIQAINKTYQHKLKPSVFQYYELIGTQNKHPGTVLSFKPGARDANGHQGPITGVYTNSNNLVNSALESYTQKNFSCILCHVRARPLGVPEAAWEEDYFKTLTFLLQTAHSRFSE